MKGWTHAVDLALLRSATPDPLPSIHLLPRLVLLLPGVTLVVEDNVGVHAALPRLVQNWALHGKKIHICCFVFVCQQLGVYVSVSWFEHYYFHWALLFSSCFLRGILILTSPQ